MSQVKPFIISPDHTITDTIACIDRNRRGIALVVDSNDRLIGTITDGDIRRAVLSGIPLSEPAQVILDRKLAAGAAKAVSAPASTEPTEALRIMHDASIRQLPLVDEDNRVVDLLTIDDLVPEEVLDVHAVVMAGGRGMRLRPLTTNMPKPMLPIGDRPLMEHIVDQLRGAGIGHVTVTTHFLPERIKEHFGDGENFGVRMDYLSEKEPLGTAGPLAQIPQPEKPLLVMNGDILTRVNLRAMLEYHREHNAELTVGVRQYDFQVPYGVVESAAGYVKTLHEKPVHSFFVNAGIYLLEPSAHGAIPSGRRFDMTDLIRSLVDEGRLVASFPIIEYWLDIGRPDDYDRAQRDIGGALA